MSDYPTGASHHGQARSGRASSRSSRVLVGLVGDAAGQRHGASAARLPQPRRRRPRRSYGCINPVDAYGAPRACQLPIQVSRRSATTTCRSSSTPSTPSARRTTKVTITFINPSGPNVVYADLPLDRDGLWPGAVPGPDGQGIDWPGWTQLPDGSWVEGDEFDWVRPSVKVLFEVNPEATVTVAYPPSSPTCNTNPPATRCCDDPRDHASCLATRRRPCSRPRARSRPAARRRAPHSS